MTEADTHTAPSNDGGGVPPAGAQEHLIPKSRFDEVLQSNRQAQQTIQELTALLQRQSPQNQPQPGALPPDLNPEELGLEPHQFKAMMKIADHLSDSKVKALVPGFKQQLGMVMNTAEEASFVAREGAEAGKYVEKIRAFRDNHYRTTGVPMDIGTAYKLIRYDELTSKGRSAPAPQAQPAQAQAGAAAPAAAPAAQPQGFPTGDLTRGAPGAAAAQVQAQAGSQELDEKGLEDLEAQLDRQLAAAGQKI